MLCSQAVKTGTLVLIKKLQRYRVINGLTFTSIIVSDLRFKNN
jgi:hypothetical protein